MTLASQSQSRKRYTVVTEEKAAGQTYTPKLLSDFVAAQIVELAHDRLPITKHLRILDPAIGDGQLLMSLLGELKTAGQAQCEIYGFETNQKALSLAIVRLKNSHPQVSLHLKRGNFLEFVLEHFDCGGTRNLFSSGVPETYDIIIANPPYVRTQIMGSRQAQLLARQFGLSGRVDLYHAFLLGMAQVLRSDGIAGIIVSNRFMTTKSGASIRKAIQDRFDIRHVWDLGDTKIFDAAVLPAVLLVEGKTNRSKIMIPAFTSIYETSEPAHDRVSDPIAALAKESGTVETNNGKRFRVQQGILDSNTDPDGLWRVATEQTDAWLATVDAHSWGKFGDIGKIRVGVKTCADKVFIRCDWDQMSPEERPELLRPLATHHAARRFKALTLENKWQILYPHEVRNGTRGPVDLSKYPCSARYLEHHKGTLESRKYVIEAGRRWYEIWVPQDPAAWDEPKLIFPDISEKPTFWIDQGGTIVNGDCYWLKSVARENTELLWLAAAIGNSSFIEAFYDHRFHNKLYAGRRRFITQYVEKFPLPDPHTPTAKMIVENVMRICGLLPSSEAEKLWLETDGLIWRAFGLCEKVVG
jgi:adenine-specific DNA-methyltransferase